MFARCVDFTKIITCICTSYACLIALSALLKKENKKEEEKKKSPWGSRRQTFESDATPT
jgi:hypothetical protein